MSGIRAPHVRVLQTLPQACGGPGLPEFAFGAGAAHLPAPHMAQYRHGSQRQTGQEPGAGRWGGVQSVLAGAERQYGGPDRGMSRLAGFAVRA
jgi:hypothetical protein